MDSTKEKK